MISSRSRILYNPDGIGVAGIQDQDDIYDPLAPGGGVNLFIVIQMSDAATAEFMLKEDLAADLPGARPNYYCTLSHTIVLESANIPANFKISPAITSYLKALYTSTVLPAVCREASAGQQPLSP